MVRYYRVVRIIMKQYFVQRSRENVESDYEETFQIFKFNINRIYKVY